MINGVLKLDWIDLRILCYLQQNSCIINVILVDVVGFLFSFCLICVKCLEKVGYISGYGVYICLEKLVDVQIVFIEVMLLDYWCEDFVKFEVIICNVDEIIECYLVSGGYDYLFKFMICSVVYYQSVIELLLEQNLCIEKYFSYIVIKLFFIKYYYLLEKFIQI